MQSSDNDSVINKDTIVRKLNEAIQEHAGSSYYVENNSDFNILVFFENVNITVSGKEIYVLENSLLIVKPNNSIAIRAKSEVFGHIYSLNVPQDIIYSCNIYQHLFERFDFLKNDEIYLCPFMGMELYFVSYIYNKIKIFESKSRNLYSTLVKNCVEYLLLNCLYNIENKNTTNETEKFFYKKIIAQFKDLLDAEYKNHKDVNFYAKKLFLSPKKLSEITKEYLGLSPKKIIINKLIKEAITYLKETDMSISEITYELGFTDEGNFSKFFKTYTSYSPSLIRSKGILSL
jgi:AraC family transcriptional activator of pobA